MSFFVYTYLFMSEDIALALDVIRLVTGCFILFYASYTDIKTRRASNYLWVLMGLIGGLLILIQYATNSFKGDEFLYLIFIPIMIVIVYVMFQMRLIFGGADAKALMALAVLIPIQPEIYGFPMSDSTIPAFSWVVFFNSLLVFMFIPIGLCILNIIRRDIKFPHVFLGYKMSIENAHETFVWPLEKFIDGKLKMVYMPKEFDMDEELNEFERQNIKRIWVTPKIPFMIPLLIGFICAFIFGDFLNVFLKLLGLGF